MNDNQAKKIVEKIKKTTDSNYKIAQETGITEATIGNYKNGKTMPTKANIQLLLKYFSEKEGFNQIISGDRNVMSGRDSFVKTKDSNENKLLAKIEELERLILEKDNIIKQLLKQQEKLINKL